MQRIDAFFGTGRGLAKRLSQFFEGFPVATQLAQTIV
jgi:hypothetical protein